MDDGSPDGSGNICDEYKSKDNRIKVIHKPNGGVSSARNRGIEEANGEWCCFIDSDDWLEPMYLQNFVNADLNTADHFLQGYHKVQDGTGRKSICQLEDKIFCHVSDLIVYLEESQNVHNGFLWHRLFKTCIIHENNICFDKDLSYAEDGLFMLEYLQYVRTTKTISKIGHNYRVSNAGLTSQGQAKVDLDAAYRRWVKYTEAVKIILELSNEDKRNVCICLWRIAVSWILCKTVRSQADYIHARIMLLQWLDDYDLYESCMEIGKFDGRLLLKIISIKNQGRLTYLSLCMLLDYMRYKKLIVNKVKKMIK